MSVLGLIKKLYGNLIYSLSGLVAVFRSEIAFRLELIFLVLALPLAFWLGDDLIQSIILFTSVVWILIAELLNSAVEATVDRISTHIHPLAKKAKDAGSAAVFLSIISAIIIWILILLN